MSEYRFVFTENSSGEVASGLPFQIVDNGLPQAKSSETTGAIQAFGSKVLKQAENSIFAPLNQISHGVASQAYGFFKSISSGVAVGAAVGNFAFAGLESLIKTLFDGINNRVSYLDNQAMQANERDNTLVRAGAVAHATFYERAGLSGIRNKTR